MSEMNHQRSLVALLKKICSDKGIKITAFSGDWIFCLQRGGRVSYVFGYDFSINSAAAKMICKDKSATSDLLEFHQIPHIEHQIFHGPQLTNFVRETSNWSNMLAYLDAHPQGIVCKPNEGTSGNAVFLARTPAQLEAAVYRIFANSRSLCLSPFEEMEYEYRVALLSGRIEFIYRKVRPTLRGDGKRTVRQLLLAQLAEGEDFAKQLGGMKSVADMEIDWERVPAADELVKINWRHNLGQGSKPDLVEPQDPIWKAASELALRATAALDIELASVDIAETPNGLKVLEINSGIMMETLVKVHPDGDAMATQFYERILDKALGDSPLP